MDAAWESLGPPGSNPDLPALTATHIGPRLEYERWRRSYDLEYRPGKAWVHPDNSKHRFTVESVTFPNDDPTADIAWVRSCLTDDMTLADAATGDYRRDLPAPG